MERPSKYKPQNLHELDEDHAGYAYYREVMKNGRGYHYQNKSDTRYNLIIIRSQQMPWGPLEMLLVTTVFFKSQISEKITIFFSKIAIVS